MKTKRVTALAALLLALITMIGSVPFPCSAAVYGDLSGDGAVSIADVTALLAGTGLDEYGVAVHYLNTWYELKN